MVNQCTKFHWKRTNHKEVRGTKTPFTSFYCLRLFVVVYKLVISVPMNSYHGTSVYQVSLLEVKHEILKCLVIIQDNLCHPLSTTVLIVISSSYTTPTRGCASGLSTHSFGYLRKHPK